MILLSLLLSLLLNFLPTNATNSSNNALDISCSQLIATVSEHGTGTLTYCNRYRIPVVDSNGKMMFDLGLNKRGSLNRLSMLPAMDCLMVPGGRVIITFMDQTEFVISSQNKRENNKIDIAIDADLRSKMMTENILSISFEGQKYPYNVVLKPNQSRAVQDVMNCLQN